MSVSARIVPDAMMYSTYRRSMIERHICRNGRYLENVVLVERTPDTSLELLDPVRRVSGERMRQGAWGWEEVTYQGYPLAYPYPDRIDPTAYLVAPEEGPAIPFYVAGGGDNPLLYGGLALATFAMEDLKDVSPNSYAYAKRLLAFILASEAPTENGSLPGIMLRQRNVHTAPEVASLDELCGVLLGLYFFALAAARRGEDADRARAENLLRHIGHALKKSDYSLPGAGIEWIFQWPFGRVFRDITGYSQQCGKAIPDVPMPLQGTVASVLNTAWAALTLDLDALFSFDTIDLDYTPRDLFADYLEEYPGLLRVALAGGLFFDIKPKFFNATMGAHAALMTLLPASVGRETRRDMAQRASEYFKQICYAAGALVPEELAAPMYPGAENAYFGVVAAYAAKVAREDNDGWKNSIDLMWAPLLAPTTRWVHDLPLVAHEALGAAREIEVVGNGWGTNFTWVYPDPDHSFSRPPLRWTENDVFSQLGINAGDLLARASAESLESLYKGSANAGAGLRIEAGGLDLLFPRMLLAYLDLADPPPVEEPVEGAITSLPFDGPLAAGLYVGNTNTKQVHRLTSLRGDCNYHLMQESHKVGMATKAQARAAGYDNCEHCIFDW